jgi:hypothetical protein
MRGHVVDLQRGTALRECIFSMVGIRRDEEEMIR